MEKTINTLKHLSQQLPVFFFIIFSFSPIGSRAQLSQHDSITRVQQLIQKSKLLARQGKTGQSEIQLQKAVGMASFLPKATYVESLLALSEHYYRFEQKDTAKVKVKLALKIVEDQGLKALEAKTLWLKGVIEFKYFNYSTALFNCEKGMQLAAELGDTLLKAKCLKCIAGTLRTYYNSAKDQKAITYFEESKLIFQQMKDTASWVGTLLTLTDIYRADFFKGEKDVLVKTYLEKASQLLTLYEDKKLDIKLAIAKAILLEIEQIYEPANEYYLKVLPFSEEMDLCELTQHLYLRLSNNYLEMKLFDKALAFLDKGVEACLGFLGDNGATLYAEIYKQKGNYKKALAYQEYFNHVIDSFYEIKRIDLVSEWEAKLNTREKELQIQEQKQKIATEEVKNRWLLWLIVFFICIGGVIFWGLQMQIKARKKLSIQKNLIEQQAAELRQFDQLKSRFFTNASHELRTPLTLMLGPISSALQRNRLDNRDFTFLKMAQQNGQHLLRLINSILDFSRLEAGKLDSIETPVVLYPLLRRLLSQFESSAQLQGINLTFEYHANPYLQIQLDVPKFEIIINNLLSNALKFTEKGGNIEVTAKDLQNKIDIKVRDTGRGIHANDLPHIFERFYQSKQENALTEGGSGIGLALCQEYAKLFKGAFTVESEWGVGSIFSFTFPKKEVLGAVKTEQLIQDEAQWQKENVSPTLIDKNENVSPLKAINDTPLLLLVEDNSSLRDYIQLILQDKYQIISAENGQAAIAKLMADEIAQPALIISDVMMPIMDGFQLLQKLKSTDAWRHIPVIMLTARAELADKLKALRIGVDDYMLKPFEEIELLTRVENILQNYSLRKIENNKHPKEAKKGHTFSVHDEKWLKTQENIIETNGYTVDFNATKWAYSIAMSERQLQRKIKQLTGLSPHQYLTEIRLTAARKMLEDRRFKTVTAVAYAVGFANAQSFTRSFKKRFGKLPSQYF